MLRFQLSTKKRFFLVPCALFSNLSLLALCSLLLVPAKAQIKYEVDAQAIGTTNGVVPFWMRSNHYGSIPMAGASTSFLGRAERAYRAETGSLKKMKFWDWGMGFEGRVNTNFTNSQLNLTEGYLKARLGPLELKAGRSKETTGLTGDTTLTSGSFAMSGNSLGIPKLGLSIPTYYRLPVLGKLFSIKGNFSHGWIGNTPIHITWKLTYDYVPVKTAYTYLHQKSFYGRLGKPEWNWALYGGFSHQVTWGEEKGILGYRYNLSNWQTFQYVATGRKYHSKGIGSSKIGNQLGSIDLGFEFSTKRLNFKGYRQNFYDVGALYYLANIRDGLNGVAITNLIKRKNKGFEWNKIVFEFVNTKNQAGEIWSSNTPSGDEDYYNNYIYKEGWSYKQKSLGNPFITTRSDAKKGTPSDEREFFINNRIQLYHLGVKTRIFKWTYNIKSSYTNNFGTYKTSPEGRKGVENIIKFQPVNQFSFYIEGRRNLANKVSLGYSIAVDRGALLQNSTGLMVVLSKEF